MGQFASSSSSSKKKKTADRETIMCIICQCSENVPHISKGFKYFEVLIRGKILQMEYLFWKEIPVNIAVAVLCVFLILSLNIFVLHIKDLPTTTTCPSNKTLKQSSQLQYSNSYTYIIHLQRSDICYDSSLYKSPIRPSVRLYIIIYVERVWCILYFHINITSIKTNKVGGKCSKKGNTQFSAGNPKERKKLEDPDFGKI